MQETVGSSPIIRFVWVKIPCKSIVFRLEGRVSGVFLPLFLAEPFKTLAHPTFRSHLEAQINRRLVGGRESACGVSSSLRARGRWPEWL